MWQSLCELLGGYFWESLFFEQSAPKSQCNTLRCKHGFVIFLSFCRNNILSKIYVQFSWLKECDNTKLANTVIAAHVEMLINGFNERFHYLKAMEFLSWLTQPLLVDLSAVSEQCQQELCELQQDEFLKTFFKGTTLWLSKECEKKYHHSRSLARQKLTSFPSFFWSYASLALLRICCVLRTIN